jgi:hypothetical protein
MNKHRVMFLLFPLFPKTQSPIPVDALQFTHQLQFCLEFLTPHQNLDP